MDLILDMATTFRPQCTQLLANITDMVLIKLENVQK